LPVFENVSTNEISVAIDELIGCLGVKEEQSCLHMFSLLGMKETQQCIQEIAVRLGLPVRIILSYVPNDFKPSTTGGFQSSSLSRTDRSGHGVEGITAQVSIPTALPLVAVMAHELSHVLLGSLYHPNRDSELHTDLVPILLGFRDCVRRGRKDIRQTTTDGGTRTHTTTYGYLTDEQFEFACGKVIGILDPHEREKQGLAALLKQIHHSLHRTKTNLGLFRDYLSYLDTKLTTRIGEKDAHKIVQFHTWDYTGDWEKRMAQATVELEATEVFVRTLNHYTSNSIKELGGRRGSANQLAEQVDQLAGIIASDVKTLRRHVGLLFRLRRAFTMWSSKRHNK
jgi:hypothetical protein